MCKKSPRACSPSRLDDSYYTESSSEMDISSYSPKSVSDVSIASSENQTVISLNQKSDTAVTTTPSAEPTIESAAKRADAEAGAGAASNLVTSTTTVVDTEAAYIDEIYTKISEYYRGIFSNIDLKDPNINADVLNYYQLIRQFYEQTMSANIQRNRAIGIAALSGSLPGEKGAAAADGADVATIDLTVLKKATAGEEKKSSVPFENAAHGSAKSPALSIKPEDGVGESKAAGSAAVPFNVSSNSLKSSCKTTPPKKRYSIYSHNDGNGTAEQSDGTPPGSAAASINLSGKFEAEATTSSDFAPLPTASDDLQAKFGASGGKAKPKSPPLKSEPNSAITDIIPITSTYLQLMRSMGFSEEDAMKFDNVVSVVSCFVPSTQTIRRRRGAKKGRRRPAGRKDDDNRHRIGHENSVDARDPFAERKKKRTTTDACGKLHSLCSQSK